MTTKEHGICRNLGGWGRHGKAEQRGGRGTMWAAGTEPRPAHESPPWGKRSWGAGQGWAGGGRGALSFAAMRCADEQAALRCGALHCSVPQRSTWCRRDPGPINALVRPPPLLRSQRRPSPSTKLCPSSPSRCYYCPPAVVGWNPTAWEAQPRRRGHL